MPLLLVAVLIVWSVSVAHAGYFFCGNGVRPQCADTDGVTQIIPSIDPSLVTDETCVEVPEAQVASQKALVSSVVAAHANGRCHLTRANGLMAAMTQGEQDAVNAAIQVMLDNQQAYNDAVTNNDLCNATLEELATAKAALDSNLTGDIAGITNIATAKTELQDMMTRLTNAMDKLMRCIRGRAGPPQ